MLRKARPYVLLQRAVTTFLLITCGNNISPLIATEAVVATAIDTATDTDPAAGTKDEAIHRTDTSERAIIGYFPDYRSYIDLNRVALHLTDLILFSISPNANGSILPAEESSPRPCCLNDDHFKKARKSRYHKRTVRQQGGGDPKLRILVSVGGAGRSQHFPAIVSDDTKRKRLVKDLLRLCSQEQLDGIDFDWEVPRNEAEYMGYLQLVSETYLAFHDENRKSERPLMVTMALHPRQFLPKKFYDYVDRIHVMTYDMVSSASKQEEQHHASFHPTVQAMQAFVKSGCPASKLALGIPAYARHSQNPEKVMTYSEIMDALLKEKQKLSPSLNSYNGFFFDSPDDVRRKVKWSVDHDYAGIFFWEIGQDKVFGSNDVADDDASLDGVGLIEAADMEVHSNASASSSSKVEHEGL